MANGSVPLGSDCRVSLPPATLESIADLKTHQKRAVCTELERIAAAEYSPQQCVYEHHGSLKVFRSGDAMRLFGAVIEHISVVEFDHLVIIFEVSEHDYQTAGVSRSQADAIAAAFSQIGSRDEFYARVRGDILDVSDIRDFCRIE